jgi:hypothetical protein
LPSCRLDVLGKVSRVSARNRDRTSTPSLITLNLAFAGEIMEPRNDVRPRPTIAWPYAGGIVGYHLLALLALVPWFFTWSGVVLSFVGLFVFGTLGINLGYHRLLTHRGLICPKWLERTFVILGVCVLRPGYAGPLGVGPSHASSTFR